MIVDEPWNRIPDWCRVHAPRTVDAVLPPPAPGAMAAARSLFEPDWPADLVRLYEIQGGASRYGFQVAPLFSLLTPERVVEETTLMRELAAEFADDDGAQLAAAEQALTGTTAFAWLAAYVPFAGLDGCLLFVDLREGPLQGCVREWRIDGADDAYVRAPSVTVLLDDMGTALETGRSFDGWVAQVVDGKLDWDIAAT